MERRAAVSGVMGITSALVQGGRSSLKEISRSARRSITTSTCDLQAAVSPSPWLMLRPEVESGGDTVHRFYSFEEDKVSWVGKTESGRIVGSSHGWLALFNLSNRSLFLSDPVGGAKIALPSVATLPKSDDWVYRVILSSSSPGVEGCRAFMIYGPDRRLASCVPGLSDTWSPIGVVDGSRRYHNIAYSNTRNSLFCLSQCKCKYYGKDKWTNYVVESLDLGKAKDDSVHCFHENYDWPGSSKQESILKEKECLKFYYPVMDEDSDQLYVVVRHVLPRVGRQGYVRGSLYYSPLQGWDRGCAHKTVDFDVYKIDMERKKLTVVESLDGLAMFVGINHPFAVRPTTGSSQMQPNSIYFTDLPDHISWYYSCHDNGIFNHESRSFSSCHPDYPIDLQGVKQTRRSVEEMLSEPLPLWYTPTTTK